MARSTFGGYGGDQVSLDPAVNSGFYKAAANLPATGTFWSASTGGTQYTDLVDPVSGVALTGVSTDAHGHVALFKGPDGITEGWVDFGAGRFKLTAVDSGIFQTTSGLDTAVNAVVGSAGTATRTTLDGRYVIHGDLVLNVKDYGAKVDGVTNDTTALANTYAALPASGGVIFIPAGTMLAALPVSTKPVVYRGAGLGSTNITVTSGSAFTAPASTVVQELTFENLTLSSSASHLFDLGSSSSGLANCRFERVKLSTTATGASWMHGTGSCHLVGVFFKECEFSRPAGATVPGFDLSSSAGAINANTWQDCTAYGNLNTTQYAWRLEGTLGSFVHDNTWRNIIGEQNCGGLIQLLSASGVVMENVTDWDAGATAYTNDLVSVGKSATSGGVESRRLTATNVGTRFGTMTGGKYHVNFPTGTCYETRLQGIGDPNGTSLIGNPYVGISIGQPRGVLNQTASYTLTANDYAVIFNGASLTATLPAPASVPIAREVTIINKNATALTVAGAAVAVTVAANTGLKLISDGGAWWPAS